MLTTATAMNAGFVVNNAAAVVTNLVNVNISAPVVTAGAITRQAGVVVSQLTQATHNTALVIGTGAVPNGNWGIFNSSTNPNEFAGPIQNANGTAAAPQDTFVSDTTTGVFRNTSGSYPWAVSISGTERFGVGAGVYRMNATTASLQIGTDAAASILTNEGATNVLGMRNSTAAQLFSIYNTFTSSSSNQRFVVDWASQANVALVGTRTATTSAETGRTMRLIVQGANNGNSYSMISMRRDSAPFFRQSIQSQAENNVQTTTITGNWAELGVGSSTATSGTIVAVAMLPTYNQASGTAANTDLLINRTETAIGSGAQYLIQGQVGSADKFLVTNAGVVTSYGNGLATTSTDRLVLENQTTATSGAPVQISPRARLRGQGWDTDSSITRAVDIIEENLPISNTNVDTELRWGFARDGGTVTYGPKFTFQPNTSPVGQLALPNDWALAFADSSANIRRVIRVDSANTLKISNVSGGTISMEYGTADVLTLKSDSNIGAELKLLTVNRTINASNGAATLTSVGGIPAGAILMAVSSRVTTAFNGTLTSLSIGTVASPTAFSSATGITLGTTTDPTSWTDGTQQKVFPTATDLVITANGGTFGTTGQIKVLVTYMTQSAASN